MNIPFVDFKREYRDLKKEVSSAIKRVINSGHYILGGEVEKFEKEFSGYIGSKYAVGVANGTEALYLALLSCGIKKGDEVITAANTCAPTIMAIIASGAIPILADADPITYCLDIKQVKKKITRRTKAVIPVHLYGQITDMGGLFNVSRKHGLKIIEDCAQAAGAKYKNKMAGSMGACGCFSFYPTKNIGALGDGGIITTNSRDLAGKLRLFRNYGQKDRYSHESFGINSRLDELHAAILHAKLRKLDTWNSRRREIADRYRSGINNSNIILPAEAIYVRHAYHLFVVRAKLRDSFRNHLTQNGIPTLIHYPIPIHRQKFYSKSYKSEHLFPVAERLAREVVSLPLYPYLRDEEIDFIIRIINSFLPKK